MNSRGWLEETEQFGPESVQSRIRLVEEEFQDRLPKQNIPHLIDTISQLKKYPATSYCAVKFIHYVESLRRISALPPGIVVPKEIEKSEFMKNTILWSGWDTLQSLTNQRSIRANLATVLRFILSLTEKMNSDPYVLAWHDVFRRASDYDTRDFERILLRLVQDINDTFIGTILTLLPQFAIRNLMDILQTVIDWNTPSRRHLEQFLKEVVKHSSYLPRYLFLEGIKRIGTNAVGGGGFSDVWKGDLSGEIVALKVLRAYIDDNSRSALELIHKEFCKEAMIWRQLRHPNLLPFYGVLENEFHPLLALVAPWMPNGHLVGYLKRNPDANRILLISGVARGLEYLHSLKPCVVHGDLRGANVLIDNQGQARIADFGLARIVDSQASTVGRTSLKGRGSIRWQAPELLDPKRFQGELCKTTRMSDVYAFASVCLEVFTDNIPFPHLRDGQVIMEIVLERKHPPRPPEPAESFGLSDFVWALMESCWSYEANNRPTLADINNRLKLITPEHHNLTKVDEDPAFLRRIDALNINIDDSSILIGSSTTIHKGKGGRADHLKSPTAPGEAEMLLIMRRKFNHADVAVPAISVQMAEAPGDLRTSSARQVSSESPHEGKYSDSPFQYFDNIDNEMFGIDKIGSPVNESSSGPLIPSSPFDMFGIGVEAPTWRVLPVALRKHNIRDEAWYNYVLFVWYGTTELCLSYDAKPLLIFQMLKEAKKNPMFMLKHVKDVRSPISVAKEKQAILFGGVSSPQRTSRDPFMRSVPKSPLRATNRPEKPNRTDMNNSSQQIMDKHSDFLPGSFDVSYAVAIYPYMTEQQEELNVFMGDAFLILNRKQRRLYVQRDFTGSGVLDEHSEHKGWVPTGCFLEIRVPLAVAFTEAKAVQTFKSDATSLSWYEPLSCAPILPGNIKSSSTAGLVLLDYTKKTDEEVSLAKNDQVCVYKRYKHWAYVIKESTGHRGWMPAWIIGKPVNGVQSDPPLTILAPASATKPALTLDTSGFPLSRDTWSNFDSAASVRSEDDPMLPTPPPESFHNLPLGGTPTTDIGICTIEVAATRETPEFRKSEPILLNAPPGPNRHSTSRRYGRIWGDEAAGEKEMPEFRKSEPILLNVPPGPNRRSRSRRYGRIWSDSAWLS